MSQQRVAVVAAPNECKPPSTRDVAKVWRVGARRIGRAALVGVALRLALGILKSLVKQRFSRKLIAALRDECLTLNPPKWGVVFAGWAAFRALCTTIDFILMRLLPAAPKVAQHVSTIAAGAIAAQSIRVMETPTQTELGLYMLSRATHGVAVTYVLPALPPMLRDFPHYAVLGVGLSGAQILYGLVFEPQTHSPAYRTFLENCVMSPRYVWDTVAAYHRNMLVPNMLKQYEAMNLAPPADGVGTCRTLCKVVHPRVADCNLALFDFALRHMKRFSIPLYLPLKITTTLIFGHKKAMKDPLGTAWKITSSVLQSAAFLTFYCGFPMRTVCFFSDNNIRSGWGIGLAVGAACAIPTFLEPPARRLDLALYCNMHAFRSWYLMMYQRGYWPRPTRHTVMFMYTVALTAILHHLRFHPETMHSNMRSGFSFVLGEKAAEQRGLHMPEEPAPVTPPTRPLA